MSIWALIAVVVLIGLAAVAYQLFKAQTQIEVLRARSLPRLVKLSQLSQEAAASIAIAPALSTNPSRFEFETLLSRIEDKSSSQAALLGELGELITDSEGLETLKNNSALLSANQTALTTVVRQQINVRKRLEKHYVRLRKMALAIERVPGNPTTTDETRSLLSLAIVHLQAVLHDPVRARFSRNRREIQNEIERLAKRPASADPNDTPAQPFLSYWSDQGERILEDKAKALTNAFKIKALVEENSLIANRLLNSANSEFARSSSALTQQVRLIASATRFNIIVMGLVAVAFIVGALFLWLVLQSRVLRRLDSLREALRRYSNSRHRILKDEAPDEIGEISRAMGDYMTRIDQQEDELQRKTKGLERLSTRLAKYLSPQVYQSIFAGKQNVALSSARKKLTVFFSDVVGFTELADQQESEELTRLLNNYLTEMSRIALDFGGTIDKYVGDAIMIFFGDPETTGTKQDALQCVRMAIAMRERLTVLNETWRKTGLSKPMICRTGIHTGFCTVGNFGSDERMDYTIIGGTVNTASRLESVAEPGQILISYETYALVQDQIDCEEQGQIEVRGIVYPITTYAVLQRQAPSTDKNREFQESHSGLHIEINRDEMTEEERSTALAALQRAIKHVKA